MCVVCEHFPCQNILTPQPPFTFNPVIPSSPFPASPDKNLSGWDHRINNLPRLSSVTRRPVALWPLDESKGAGLILSSRPCDLQKSVLFCFPGEQIGKANFPPLILVASWSYWSPPLLPLLDCIPLTKQNIIFTISPPALVASSTFIITCIRRCCQQHKTEKKH